MAVLASVIGLMRVSLPPRLLDEPAVEMVFEPANEAPAAERVSEASPRPSPPRVQAPEPSPEPPQPEATAPEPTPPVVEPEQEPPEPPPPPTIASEPVRPPPKPARKQLVKPLPAKIAPVQAVHRDPPPAVLRTVGPPVMAPTPAAPATVDGGWPASVADWLASRKTYPEEARRQGEEGRVVIRFTVDRSGHVIEANIVGSSGSERLDAATLALLRNASLPAFPQSMPQARMTITTSVRYTLR
jgi:protein TonB